ncbi:right-handed parallel beta-helix repeat-containing protein, partial [Bacteroidales bacterium OttesenSCG-928-C19]|nr:right-handed parallel beta-helix repeat-containing protein [Bacteroidales bacterium OttesenSCG-928-C19]
AKDGTLLTKNKIFETGILEDDTTFYVQAFDIEKISYTVIEGTIDTFSNTKTSPDNNQNIRVSPYTATGAANGNKVQYIIDGRYLKRQFLQSGDISGMEFYLDTLRTTLINNDKLVFDEYSITLMNTPRTDYVTGTNSDSFIEINDDFHYTKTNFEISKNDEGTWVTHNFDRTFEWDGESSILVQICRKPNATYVGKVFPTTKYIINDYNKQSVIYAAVKCDNIANTKVPASPMILPSIRFIFNSYGCATDIVDKKIVIKDRPKISAEISAIYSPFLEGNEKGNIDLDIEIRNDGQNRITEVPVYWQIVDNGTAGAIIDAGSAIWTGSLDKYQTDRFLLQDTLKVPASGYYNLRVWADMPNDENRKGDTMSIDFKVCYSAGDYLLSKTDISADFSSFNDALMKLSAAGICGNVVVKAESGEYNEQLNVPAIPGAGNGDFLTFTSKKGDNTSVILKYSSTDSANYIINVENVQGVVFENFTFSPQDTIYSGVFRVKNSRNIKLTKNIIKMPKYFLKDTLNIIPIVFEGSTDNVEVSSNDIGASYIAMKVKKDRNLKSEIHQNLLISKNTITDFFSKGIELYNTENVTVIGNYFNRGDIGIVTRLNIRGIELNGNKDEFNISKNEIILNANINTATTQTMYGILIANSTITDGVSSSLLSNNMISIKRTLPSSFNQISAIKLSGSNNINIYFNTARVYPSSSTSINLSKVVEISDESYNIRLKNNNLINANRGLVMQIQNKIALLESAYNNFYSFGNSSIIKIGNAGPISLDGWRITTGMDENEKTISKNYPFVSEINLRQREPDLLFAGTMIQDERLKNDIDETERLNPPSIGAHEYIRSARDITPIDIYCTPISTVFQEDDSLRIQLYIRNVGTDDIDTVVFGVKSKNAMVPESSFVFDRVLKAKSGVNKTDVDTFTAIIPIKSGYIGMDSLIVYTDIWGENPETRNNDTILYGYEIKPGYDFSASKIKALFNPEFGRCGTDSTKVIIRLKNESRRTLSETLGRKLTVWLEIKEESALSANTYIYKEVVQKWGTFGAQGTESITLDTVFNFKTRTDASYEYAYRYWISYEGDMNISNDTSDVETFTIDQRPMQPYTTNANVTINYATQTLLKVANDPVADKFIWYNQNNSALAEGLTYKTPILEGSTLYRVVAKSKGGCPGDTLIYRVNVKPREAYDVRPVAIHWPKDSLVYTHSDTIIISFKNEGYKPITPSSNLWLAYSVDTMKVVRNSLTNKFDTTWVEASSGRELYDGSLEENGAETMFKFKKLAEFPFEGQKYHITVYTDLATDNTRNNDTIYDKLFISGNSRWYCDEPNVANYVSSTYGVDISNVSLGISSNETPSVGNKYTDFTSGTNAISMFEVYKGVEQILSITCNSTIKPETDLLTISGWVKVYVDWNRNGIFEPDDNEEILLKPFVAGVPVLDTLKIPTSNINGAMKMRIVATSDIDGGDKITPCSSIDINNGEVEDYKLFVRSPYNKNATLASVISPDRILTNPSTEIKVVLHNTGNSTLTEGVIKYKSSEDSTATIHSYTITEPIIASSSQEITLGNHYFEEGIIPLSIWVEIPGDENSADDTLKMNIYSPPIRSISYRNNFDDADELGFLAPEGTYYIHRNLWTKDSLWRIERGRERGDDGGNISYLYSPIFDVSEIKPDTLSFDLSRKLSSSTKLYVEYFNKEKEWVLLGTANDIYGTNWYDDDVSNSFTGKNESIQTCQYSLFKSLDGKLGNLFQLRFVFVATAEETTESNYVRIDNFTLLRSASLRDMEITYHIGIREASYGDDYYPSFVIKNSGTTEVRNCMICYGVTPPSSGNYTEKCFLWTGRLKYEEIDTVRTSDPKYNAPPIKITHHMGDTIIVCAYTKLNMEEKPENDTACIDVSISKRTNDLALNNIIFPLENNISPSVSPITVRIENFGDTPKKQGTVSFSVDNKNLRTLNIDFVELLGENGLEPGDSIDITFPDSLLIDFYGKVLITVSLGVDDYLANNTLTKYIQGVSSLKDIKAERIILNNLGNGELEVQLDISNQGTIGVNLFDVGFTCIIGPDTISVSEVFWREKPLQSLQKEYHKFDIKLVVADMAMIDGICAYVSLPGDNNIANDTTCQIYIGYIDMSPTVLLIEEDPLESKCRMMLNVENKGTIVVDEVKLDVTVDNTTHSMVFNEYPLMPGKTFGILLDGKIDKKSNYKVLSKVTTKGDVNTSNDTSSRYETTPIIVGIDDVDSVDLFRLEQNYPNPFTETTE